MANRVSRQLLRYSKRRSARGNYRHERSSSIIRCVFLASKHHDQLTTNMDSYLYTPSDSELQQLLYV